MLKFTVLGLDTATAEVQAAAQAGIQEALGVIGARAEALVKQNIASPYGGMPARVSTGNLLNSVHFSISREAPISRVRVFAGPPADTYADPVEFGARAHFPPPGALLLWVKRKFRVESEKKALSIAFAVARNIAKRGMRAFNMFGRAVDVLQGELQGIVEAAIARALSAAGVGTK